jgi:hypothetical protein
MGPHRWDKRVLLCGVKVCLTIKWIILSVVVSLGYLLAEEPRFSSISMQTEGIS